MMRLKIPPHLSLQETSPEVAASIQSLVDHIDECYQLINENKKKSQRLSSELKQVLEDCSNVLHFQMFVKEETLENYNADLKKAKETIQLLRENSASFVASNMNLLQENLGLKAENARYQEIIENLAFKAENASFQECNNTLLEENLGLKAENASFQEINTALLVEKFGLEADLDTNKGCVELQRQLIAKLIISEEEGETEKACSSSRGVMQQIKDNRDILTSHAHTVSAMIEKYNKIIDEFPTPIDDFPNLRNEPELRMVAEMQKILWMKEQLGLPLAEVGLKERVRVCEIGFPRHNIKK